MATQIIPYKRGHYPTIEGNDRVFFDDEFRKIEQCLRQIIDTFLGGTNDVTIASGVITCPTTRSPVLVFNTETEAAAASDDLDTISGGSDGQLAVVKAISGSHTVVCKDGTGNLNLAGDFSLDNTQDMLTLVFHNDTWRELSRSDNGA
jgi:hypothetical protein